MKKILAALMTLVLLMMSAGGALAVNEDVEGELAIYTSMYQFMIDILDEKIKEEFPNLKPGLNGSFFYYSGAKKLVDKIRGEVGQDYDQPVGCDMFLVAEPSFSLELKEHGYLHEFEVEDAENRFRFPYDPDGAWYPVRVCNMVLACNPEAADYWAQKGVNVPKSFHDFAYDPSLKGYISMSNPLESGTAYAAVCALLDKYGEEYFDKLRENAVMRESGSTAISKLQTNECAAIMILEESILRAIDDEAKKGNTVTNLSIIYPEDGVILIPSTLMIVKEELSRSVNTEAAEAVAQWLLSEEGQRGILQGYMHAVLSGLAEYPTGSMETDKLVKMDMGVDWEKAYKQNRAITQLWETKVTQ